MNPNDQKRLRKCITLLKTFRDDCARDNDTGTAAKFSRAAALLIEILEEERKADAGH